MEAAGHRSPRPLPPPFTPTWVNAQQVAEAASVSLPAAYKLIKRFLENKLLREITGAKRDRIFLFEPYLQLFR